MEHNPGIAKSANPSPYIVKSLVDPGAGGESAYPNAAEQIRAGQLRALAAATPHEPRGSLTCRLRLSTGTRSSHATSGSG
jgi:hypothetical protein